MYEGYLLTKKRRLDMETLRFITRYTDPLPSGRTLACEYSYARRRTRSRSCCVCAPSGTDGRTCCLRSSGRPSRLPRLCGRRAGNSPPSCYGLPRTRSPPRRPHARCALERERSAVGRALTYRVSLSLSLSLSSVAHTEPPNDASDGGRIRGHRAGVHHEAGQRSNLNVP
jgi:hypothetical protein